VEGTLYKRGFITPFIKCLGPSQTQEDLADVHDGIFGQHLGAKALAKGHFPACLVEFYQFNFLSFFKSFYFITEEKQG